MNKRNKQQSPFPILNMPQLFIIVNESCTMRFFMMDDGEMEAEEGLYEKGLHRKGQ